MRLIVAQPVTFSAADPERREGPPACVCAWGDWGFVCDVKHMSPRVLIQGGVCRDDKREEEERPNDEGVHADVKFKSDHQRDFY